MPSDINPHCAGMFDYVVDIDIINAHLKVNKSPKQIFFFFSCQSDFRFAASFFQNRSQEPFTVSVVGFFSFAYANKKSATCRRYFIYKRKLVADMICKFISVVCGRGYGVVCGGVPCGNRRITHIRRTGQK